MSDFKIGQTVKINTPGESEHGKTGYVMSATETKVFVDLGDMTWMYFHGEVDTV